MIVAGSGAGLTSLAMGAPAAHGDPAFTTSYAGVGSDVLNDLFDAYGGADNGAFYTPIASSSTTGSSTVSSWEALPAGGSASTGYCITTKLNGPAFDRPNGSSAGIDALLDAVNGTGWEATQASLPSCTNAPVSVTGQIDFARSARGPKSTGSTLTFIPFARDAEAYAYVDHKDGNTTIGTLTTAQLASLYSSSTGKITVGSDTVEACLPPSGSAVRTNFETSIGVSDTTAAAAAAASGCGSDIEQNQANGLATYGATLPAGTDAIIPFSVGSWIAQTDGVAQDNSSTGVTAGAALGDPNGTAGSEPYSGTGTSLTPSATYDSSAYGVTLYVVVPTRSITTGGAFENQGLESLFVGSTSALCSSAAQTEAAKFGFSTTLPTGLTCGATTSTGNS